MFVCCLFGPETWHSAYYQQGRRDGSADKGAEPDDLNQLQPKTHSAGREFASDPHTRATARVSMHACTRACVHVHAQARVLGIGSYTCVQCVIMYVHVLYVVADVV